MKALRLAACRVAPYPTTVLVTGETGTGKGVLARAIHRASPRRTEPFVHVDCGGLAGPLLEAELYGVARGAFTGAHESRSGRFESAGAGTLFLDEIAELPLSGQTKLLRALEEGTFERVGETRARRLGARIIAATHVDLDRAIREGRFRADLFFRLRVVSLHVPPLRLRPEDLPAWIERAAHRAASRLSRPVPRFEPQALDHLKRHSWPGNLRELFHVVEAASIWTDGPVDVPLVERLLSPPPPPPPPSIPASAPVAPGSPEASIRSGDAPPGVSRAAPPGCWPAGGGPGRDQIARALEESRGNLALAARKLGMPRSTLRARVGRDDPVRRMRRRRRRQGSGDRGESTPDQAQGDQGQSDAVELREE